MSETAFRSVKDALEASVRAAVCDDKLTCKLTLLQHASLQCMEAAASIRKHARKSEKSDKALSGIEALSWTLQIWDQAIGYRNYRQRNGPAFRPESLLIGRTVLERECQADTETLIEYAHWALEKWQASEAVGMRAAA